MQTVTSGGMKLFYFKKKYTAFPNTLKLKSYGERLQIIYFYVFPFKNKNTILEHLIKY